MVDHPELPAFVTLIRLLTDEIPLDEFEQWVYTTENAEIELGAESYFTLLAFDYRQRHALHELKRCVEMIYERLRPGMLVPDRARRLACGLLDGSITLPAGVHGLADLWYAGHEWIPTEFVGISSELDDLPLPEQYPLWEPIALVRKLTGWKSRLQHLTDDATAAAREFVRTHFPNAPCG